MCESVGMLMYNQCRSPSVNWQLSVDPGEGTPETLHLMNVCCHQLRISTQTDEHRRVQTHKHGTHTHTHTLTCDKVKKRNNTEQKKVMCSSWVCSRSWKSEPSFMCLLHCFHLIWIILVSHCNWWRDFEWRGLCLQYSVVGNPNPEWRQLVIVTSSWYYYQHQQILVQHSRLTPMYQIIFIQTLYGHRQILKASLRAASSSFLLLVFDAVSVWTIQEKVFSHWKQTVVQFDPDQDPLY